MNDFRYAVRQLLKRPGFTAVAVLTLALGMGASAAIYTALERVVLAPLPYPDAERLVRLRSSVPAVSAGTEWDVSEGAWWFFRAEARTLDGIGAYSQGGVTVGGADGPVRVQRASVTASTLAILGARPAVGRLINEDDDAPGAEDVVVLSHGFWERYAGGDTTVIGTTLDVNERPAIIVGVMQQGFELPPRSGVPAEFERTDVWVPLTLNPAGPFWNSHLQFRTIARLRLGAALEAAQAELLRLTARLPDVVPNAYSHEWILQRGFATRVYGLKDFVVGDVADRLWILFGAVGLVLLIAYANVANLFLVRTEGRRHELAVRTALGARFGSVMRQFLAESLVLAAVAGALAFTLAFWGVDWLAAVAPEGVPRLQGLRPTGGVLAFTVGLVLVAALGVAALPAFHAKGWIKVGDLAEGGRRTTASRARQRVRSGLVVAQVALALVLMVGGGLLVESARRFRSLDLGIEPDGVLTARLYLPYQRYDNVPDMWRFYDAALERVRAVPGVVEAGLTGAIPLDGGFGCTVQGFEDAAVRQRVEESGGTTCAGQELTSPGYFEAMGIPVLQGRGLAQADFDDPERGAVVVSKAFAERFWPGEDPIGKGVGPSGRTNQQFYRVVGVVGDVYASSPAEPPAIAIYYPVLRIPGTYSSWPNPSTLVVKTALEEPLSLVPAVRAAIQEVDPAIPLADVRSMDAIVDASRAQLAFMVTLILTAAATALLLAAVGLYGVISYIVTSRTGEIGVRMALGARPRDILRLVVIGAGGLAAIGVGIGVVSALGVTRVLGGLLYGVRPTQPVVYLAAACLLGAVAAVAAYLPARRAARVDPMEALRYE
jgi:putative ABC transport system permease protein